MLDITYALRIEWSAVIALHHVEDERGQRWLTRRLPTQIKARSPVTFFPAPWTDLATVEDGRPSRQFGQTVQKFAGHPVLMEALAWSDRSRKATLSGHRKGESVRGADDLMAPLPLGSVVDWLNSLPEEDPRLLDRLTLVRWDQAVEHAQLWHERLAKLRRAGVAGDRGTANHLPVRRMEEGWLWMQLVTKGALDREGAVMGHCVGSRAYDRHAWTGDYLGSPLGIWSLRDPAGKSVATVEVGSRGIVQAFGRANARPAPETAPAFETLVGFFAGPDQGFWLPRWLERAEDGQTRLPAPAAKSEYQRVTGQAYFRQVRGQILIADEVDYGIEILQADLDRCQRVMEHPIGQIVTELTEAVTFACQQFTPLVEAFRVMAGEAFTSLVVGVDTQPVTIEATLPAVNFTPNERRNRAGEPWYRQHERARQGRRPR